MKAFLFLPALLVLLVLTCARPASAQLSHGSDTTSSNAPRRQLMGTVRDEQQNPLAGATVRVPGLMSGLCITNSHGRFLLSVPASDATILISFASYQSLELEVGDANDVEVVLTPEPGFRRPRKARVIHRRYLRSVTVAHPAL